MFKSATFVALLTAVATVSADLIINTPSGVTACEPSKLTWTGGVPPYFLDLLDGNNPSGGSIQQLQTNTTDTSYTWDVVFPPGTSLDLQIRDSQGTTAQTAKFDVGQPAAGNSACLNAGGSSSGSASSGGSTTAVGTPTKSSSSAVTTTAKSSSATVATTPATTSSGTPMTTSSSEVATTTVTTPSGSNNASTSKPASSGVTSPSPSPSPSNGALANVVSTTGLLGALVAVFFA